MPTWRVVIGLMLIVAAAGASLLGAGQGSAATLTPQDYEEIRQLYARYAHTIDTGDAEGWADVFTADGVFGNAQGRDALIEFVHTVYKANQELGRQSRHWNNSL